MLDELSGRILDVINDISDGKYIYFHNFGTNITTWSSAAVEYFNLPASKLRGDDMSFFDSVHPSDRERCYQKFRDVMDHVTDSFYYTFHVRNAKGDYVLCTGKGRVVDSGDGDMVFSGAIMVYDEDASYDPLTNVKTAHQFIKDIRKANEYRDRYNLLAIEYKNFNKINTVYGFGFGDKVLNDIAMIFKKYITDEIEMYRLEGTLFAFLIKDRDLDFVIKIFNLIRDKSAKYSLDGNSLNLEVVGATITGNEYDLNAQNMLSKLVLAVEKAKEEKSYELFIYDDERSKSNVEILELAEAVKSSIAKDCEGFYLCYQPLVSTVTGKIVGAEALLRWHSEVYGEVSPGRFIPCIEMHPCFYDLGLWVLRQAISDSTKILAYNPTFFVNVNMSYTQLERDSFKGDVIKILDEFKFPYRNLQLELTERCREMNIEFLKTQLEFFRNKGIRVALDDFGTGSSTINLLCDLPISCVKIDQSFILNILKKSNNQIIVDTVLQCARRLGITVCLEGVENEEIKNFVERYSANYHQGFYYSRPVVYNKFVEFLGHTWNNEKIGILKGNGKDNFEINNILSMMPGGFFIYIDNEDEKIRYINETMLELFECDTVDDFLELTGASFKGIVHPEDYPEVKRSIDMQLHDDNSFDFVKYRIITKKGNIKYIRDYGHLVRKEYDDNLFYVFVVEEE